MANWGRHVTRQGKGGSDFPNKARLDELYRDAAILTDEAESSEEEHESSGDGQGNSPFEVTPRPAESMRRLALKICCNGVRARCEQCLLGGCARERGDKQDKRKKGRERNKSFEMLFSTSSEYNTNARAYRWRCGVQKQGLGPGCCGNITRGSRPLWLTLADRPLTLRQYYTRKPLADEATQAELLALIKDCAGRCA